MVLHLRLAQWIENHPHISNALLVLVSGFVTIFFTVSALWDGVTWWCMLVCWLPLFFRRAAPTVVAYLHGRSCC